MNAMDLLETIGGIQDSYIAAAHSARRQRRMPRKRMLLIAAIIAVALLLVGCTVLYVLRLQDFWLLEETVTTRDAGYGPNGEYFPAVEETRNFLTPHTGKAEQQALREPIAPTAGRVVTLDLDFVALLNIAVALVDRVVQRDRVGVRFGFKVWFSTTKQHEGFASKPSCCFI